MKSIGGAMFFFGAGSIVLGLFGYEFVLLSWIDMWGLTVGWVIRAALIIVGGMLWFIGNSQEAQQPQQPSEEREFGT